MLNYTTLGSCFALFIVLSSCSTTLDKKLQKQWGHFENAQKLLLHRNRDASLPLEKRVLSRKEWEEAIKVAPEFSLTDKDIQILVKRHDQKRSQARQRAMGQSIIDFNSFRSLSPTLFKKRVEHFCGQVPKGGMLHIHPFGTFKRKTLSAQLRKKNPVIPTKKIISKLSNQKGEAYLYPDEIRWLKSLPVDPKFLSLSRSQQKRIVDFMILPKGDHPFERFEAIFHLLTIPMAPLESYRAALLDFGQRASRQKVSYVEFTEDINSRTFSFYLSIIDEYKKKYNIILRLNNSFYRLDAPEKLREEAQTLIDNFNNPAVVGIDLLGNESPAPALERGQTAYATVLNSVVSKKTNLHRTMHAGELGDLRNPRDAMIMGVQRLGHGVALIKDPVAIEYALLKGVGVVANLVSNTRLRVISDLKNHPYLNLLRVGIPVSLSTDDEGIFETDINTECLVAIKNTDINYFEMKQMAINSIETSFASRPIKAKLKKQLLKQFSRFEKEYLNQ